MLGWLGGRHPVVVVADGGTVIGWANAVPYSLRACYADVAEISVYVARGARRRGAGRLALRALVDLARSRSFHKLNGKILAANSASRRLVAAEDFREVGVHLRHGKLDGDWHDVVVVERLLDEPPPGRP